MTGPSPSSFSLTAINRKRGLGESASGVASIAPAIVPGSSNHVISESRVTAGAETVENAPSSIKLPFDPLRIIDALVRRWAWMLVVGVVCGAVLFMLGWSRFDTLHTANAQIIKQEMSAAFRQSESGETFKPRDLSIPTLTALMYSGAIAEAASLRMESRFPESAIRAGLVVAAERNTDILRISMTSGQSAEAALEMLKAYTAEVLQLSRDMQRGDATEMKRFLQEQINRTEAELVKVNEELLAYGQKEHLIDADKQMDAWLGELGNFTLKYETLKLDNETLDLRVQGIERELSKVDTHAARLDAVRSELADLRVRYTDEHPVVIEALEKLANLEEQLKDKSPSVDVPPKPGESAVAESLYLDLIRLRSEKKVMTEQLVKLDVIRTGLNARLALLPRQAMEYARIKSKQKTLETSHGLLVGRQREAALFEENALGYFKLFSMDRPQDVASVKPTKKLAMAGAGGLAFGGGVVAVLVIGVTLLDTRIRSSADLRRATGVPVVGLLPNNTERMHESEEAWAFRTWTRLQPLLVMRHRDDAMICGVMHDNDCETACRMTSRLGAAAVRRGLGCIAITKSEKSCMPLSQAVRDPDLTVRLLREHAGEVSALGMDEAWTWSLEQRQQWQAALARWRSMHGVVILLELPSVERPEALLLAEQLPNLIWAGTSGSTRVQAVSEALRMYRDAGCRLVAALLDRAPDLRPAVLARLALPLLMACSVSTMSAAESAPALVLGPGDAVNIALPGYPGHDRAEVTVGPDGRLTYLQARDIQAGGLSLDELREKLNTELRRYYRNARVIVTPFTFQSRKVYVLGKVVKKGAINLDRPLTILEVVTEAGGLETGLFQQNTVELADLGRSFVMRGQKRLEVNLEALFLRGDMTQNVRVEAGDYLYFPSANSNEIYVLGDVKMQGTQGLLAHTSVHSAIAQAGGFTEQAYTRRVLVIRGSFEKPQRFAVDMDALLSGRSQGFRLEPKDIVYIADHPWARAEELFHMAINAFLQGAVSSWTRANVGPFINKALIPPLKK